MNNYKASILQDTNVHIMSVADTIESLINKYDK